MRVGSQSIQIQAIDYIKVPRRVTVNGHVPAALPRRRAALAPARVPAPVRPAPPPVGWGLAALAPAVARPPEAQAGQRRALAVRKRARRRAGGGAHRRRVVPGLRRVKVRRPTPGSRPLVLGRLAAPVPAVLHLDHQLVEQHHQLQDVVLRLRLVGVVERLDTGDAVLRT